MRLSTPCSRAKKTVHLKAEQCLAGSYENIEFATATVLPSPKLLQTYGKPSFDLYCAISKDIAE